jgi:hypothetical protein
VKVRLDPAARQMDQQRRPQHLRDGDHVARADPSRAQHRERDRRARDPGAEEDREVDVGMDLVLVARPRVRREPQCEDDREQPLRDHEEREHPIDSGGVRGRALAVQPVGRALDVQFEIRCCRHG